MNKEELSKLVEALLADMGKPEPQVKASDYKPEAPQPQPVDTGLQDGDFVPDVSKLDLRKLYLVDAPAREEDYRRLKERTPARLGSGRAGARYKTLTMLRFRADHAAAQDAVFSEIPEDYAAKHKLLPLATCCENKDTYLTRPDLGRKLNGESLQKLKAAVTAPPRVLLAVGDGLSSAAITANAADCMAAIREGLQARGIAIGPELFIHYCRVGAGDAIGEATGCELICLLVGERPGLVTAESMSAYITYHPRANSLESSRTVVSNIHAQGTPAVEAGAHIAGLIETILEKKASGVQLEGAV